MPGVDIVLEKCKCEQGAEGGRYHGPVTASPADETGDRFNICIIVRAYIWPCLMFPDGYQAASTRTVCSIAREIKRYGARTLQKPAQVEYEKQIVPRAFPGRFTLGPRHRANHGPEAKRIARLYLYKSDALVERKCTGLAHSAEAGARARIRFSLGKFEARRVRAVEIYIYRALAPVSGERDTCISGGNYARTPLFTPDFPARRGRCVLYQIESLDLRSNNVLCHLTARLVTGRPPSLQCNTISERQCRAQADLR